MRIAYLSTFYPYRGGISQFNALLYRNLEKNNEIKAFNFSRQYPDFLFPGQTQYVTPTDDVDKIETLRLLDSINPLTYGKSATIIRGYNPDLLLMKFWMPFFAPSLGYISGNIRKKCNAKSIAILDNVIPHERKPGDLFLIRYFLKKVDGFIVMSTTVEKELLSLYPDAKYILKPHPVYEHFGKSIEKSEARKKLHLPENKNIILFFGFIRDYKGLDELLRSFSRLSDDYHLMIAGEIYGNFEKYQAIINDLNLSEKVSLFIRYIDDAEVPAFFSAADVCVLPYKSATQSGIVQIAYNFNLPVIATDKGGLSEMVTDNKTGFIISSSESALIADKIEEYFNKKCYQEFSKNILAIRNEYSWQAFSDAIMQLNSEINIKKE
jgi:glycosyltransferase involved in cell wall biosynthesis